jgi:hypothetical protein
MSRHLKAASSLITDAQFGWFWGVISCVHELSVNETEKLICSPFPTLSRQSATPIDWPMLWLEVEKWTVKEENLGRV